MCTQFKVSVLISSKANTPTINGNIYIYIYIYIYIKEERTYRESVFEVYFREEDMSHREDSPPPTPNENKASTSKIVTTRPNEEVVDEFKLFLEKLEKEWKEQSEKYNTTKEQQQQEMNKYDIPGDDECICNEYAQNLLCIFCLKNQ